MSHACVCGRNIETLDAIQLASMLEFFSAQRLEAHLQHDSVEFFLAVLSGIHDDVRKCCTLAEPLAIRSDFETIQNGLHNKLFIECVDYFLQSESSNVAEQGVVYDEWAIKIYLENSSSLHEGIMKYLCKSPIRLGTADVYKQTAFQKVR